MIICPSCLNAEITCGVRTIITKYRSGSPSHQCLICSGKYTVIIVKRGWMDQWGDPQEPTYMSDLEFTPKSHVWNKGWFTGDDRPGALS